MLTFMIIAAAVCLWMALSMESKRADRRRVNAQAGPSSTNMEIGHEDQGS